MVFVNGKRLLSRINELGKIGKDAEGRRTRLAASDADKQGRDLVSEWMKEAGLEVDRPDRKYFRYLGDT